MIPRNNEFGKANLDENMNKIFNVIYKQMLSFDNVYYGSCVRTEKSKLH